MVTICCAGGYPNWSAYLPTLKVSVLECEYVALLESGCTRSIVLPLVWQSLDKHKKPSRQRVIMMNRKPMQSSLSSVVQDDSFYKSLLDCLVTQVLPKYKMVLGMDVVSAKGGVTIEGSH